MLTYYSNRNIILSLYLSFSFSHCSTCANPLSLIWTQNVQSNRTTAEKLFCGETRICDIIKWVNRNKNKSRRYTPTKHKSSGYRRSGAPTHKQKREGTIYAQWLNTASIEKIKQTVEIDNKRENMDISSDDLESRPEQPELPQTTTTTYLNQTTSEAEIVK